MPLRRRRARARSFLRSLRASWTALPLLRGLREDSAEMTSSISERAMRLAPCSIDSLGRKAKLTCRPPVRRSAERNLRIYDWMLLQILAGRSQGGFGGGV